MADEILKSKKQTLWDLFSALMGNAGVVSQDELIRDYGKLLTEGEAIDLGFKLIRDTFIFHQQTAHFG